MAMHSSQLCTHQGCQVGILRPNSRNLAFLKVVWHEKMVFGMYVIVWHFWPLLMVLALKNMVWHFLKPLAQLLLSAWNYSTFSQDWGPLFSTTVPFSKIQAAFSQCCQLCGFPANLGLLFCGVAGCFGLVFLRVVFGLILIEMCLFFWFVFYWFLFCGLLFS